MDNNSNNNKKRQSLTPMTKPPVATDDFGLEVTDEDDVTTGELQVQGNVNRTPATPKRQTVDQTRPYGFDPHKTVNPNPNSTQTAQARPAEPKPRYTTTCMTKSPDGVPVFVVNSLVDQAGVKRNMNDTYMTAYGTVVQMIYDDFGRLNMQGMLLTVGREEVFPEITTYPFFCEDIFIRDQNTNQLTQVKYITTHPGLVLVDNLDRPIYPLGWANPVTPDGQLRGEFLKDQENRPYYPALPQGYKFFIPAKDGRPKREVKPSVQPIFSVRRSVLYPYGVPNNNVLAPRPEPQEDPMAIRGWDDTEPASETNNVISNPQQPNINVFVNGNNATNPNQDGYGVATDGNGNGGDGGNYGQTMQDAGGYNNNHNNGYGDDDYNDDYGYSTQNDESIEDIDMTPDKVWYKDPKLMGLIGGIVVLLIIGGWCLFSIFGGNKDTFELDNREVTAEYETDMRLDLEQFFGRNMSKKALEEVEVNVDPKLNYNKTTHKISSKGKETVLPGAYTIEFKYKKDSVKGVLNVQDTVAPDIRGNENVTFAVGKYSDNALIEKFDIVDEAEVKVTVDTFQQNLSKEGTYKADITAVDASNNKTTKSVTVSVMKTAQQKEEEAKAEEERKRAEEAKAEEERKRAEEEAKKACVPILPAGAYTEKWKADTDAMLMNSGMKEAPFKVGENQQIIVNQVDESNCGNPYWMLTVGDK